jgi:hypothetical protein
MVKMSPTSLNETIRVNWSREKGDAIAEEITALGPETLVRSPVVLATAWIVRNGSLFNETERNERAHGLLKSLTMIFFRQEVDASR